MTVTLVQVIEVKNEMVVLIEGNEGTGKTTLINDINRVLPSVIIKYPKEVKDTNYMLMQLLSCRDKIILIDRCFVTDMVYRMWDKNRNTQMNLWQVASLLEYYKNELKIVWCRNPDSFQNARDRGEDFITDVRDHHIIDTYYDAIMSLIKVYTDIPVLEYDFTYNEVQEVIDFIGGYNVDRSDNS